MFTGLALGRPRFLKGRALSRLPPFLLAEAAGVVGVAGAEKRDGNVFFNIINTIISILLL